MPIRNEAAFIERSLGAVLAQYYPRDRMEIIIADGMSQDGTSEIVKDALARDRILTLVDKQGNIASTGLNAALPLAKGEIVIRVDGHCEVAIDYVRRCVSRLTGDKVDCGSGWGQSK